MVCYFLLLIYYFIKKAPKSQGTRGVDKSHQDDGFHWLKSYNSKRKYIPISIYSSIVNMRKPLEIGLQLLAKCHFYYTRKPLEIGCNFLLK